MNKIILIIVTMGFGYMSFGQNLLFVDNTQLTIGSTTTLHVEGSVVLQNEGLFDNDGDIYIGSSGSGFNPATANWVVNNIFEQGNNFAATGTIRLVKNNARITGTIGPLSLGSFNNINLEGTNFTYWQDISLNCVGTFNLGNGNTWEVNNNELWISNSSPAAINSSGGGAIRLEPGPPLPSPNKWSMLERSVSTTPQTYSLPLRDMAGNDFQFTFTTLSSPTIELVGISTYSTGQNNQLLPEAFFTLPAVDDADLDGNGTDDSDNMVDRYWLVWSDNKPLDNIEFQMPAGDASSGNLTTTSPLQAYSYETDWNPTGVGTGDALSGVTINVGSTLQRVYALAALSINLPIECVGFSGKPEGLNIRLDWQTATETNNKGFEIQRSTDGTEFKTIGWADGQGTTSEATSYAFMDESTIPGREYYYRLLQFDFDGNKEFVCDVVQVRTSDDPFEGQVSIAPNPATNYSFVYLPEGTIGSVIQLSAADGRMLREIPVTSEKIRILRSDLPSGIYYLKIVNDISKLSNPLKLVFVD